MDGGLLEGISRAVQQISVKFGTDVEHSLK